MASLFSRALTFGCVGAVCLGAYACGTGDTTGITPITGIVVRADTLVQGYGCGTGPNQVYKYAAVVTTPADAGSKGAFVAGGIFDCFADATFVNLCASAGGAFVYDVTIYAFTEAQWNAKSAALQMQNTDEDIAQDPSYCTTDGGFALENAVDSAYRSAASFLVDCTATQQSNIEVLAVCPGGLVPVTPVTTP